MILAWKYATEDGMVEIVVDPNFEGNLVNMARLRPIWIVESPGNLRQIEAAWKVGEQLGLFEVSRCRLPTPDDRLGNLTEILGSLDDHQGRYKGIVVHGLLADDATTGLLEAEGFQIDEVRQDSFTALMVRSYGDG